MDNPFGDAPYYELGDVFDDNVRRSFDYLESTSPPSEASASDVTLTPTSEILAATEVTNRPYTGIPASGADLPSCVTEVRISLCDPTASDLSDSMPRKPTSQRVKLSIYKSIGGFNTFIIILGTIASFSSLRFLTFLWFGHGSKPGSQAATHAWRAILLSGRLTQMVTVSALTLRTSISMQSAIWPTPVRASLLTKTPVRRRHTGKSWPLAARCSVVVSALDPAQRTVLKEYGASSRGRFDSGRYCLT
ncbi:hypothetical protein F5Y19DRAFT_445613 [Xylariaceae sp. FL1651]|nr:hypothetical protein F5Y19DRAFT_445613 [Xylariaceae sp. FL1651]